MNLISTAALIQQLYRVEYRIPESTPDASRDTTHLEILYQPGLTVMAKHCMSSQAVAILKKRGEATLPRALARIVS